MATQKIFRYHASKSSHKTTKFDIGYQNGFTARFGELLPTTCKKVLAADKWKLGVNTLTKVQPLKAPAFTRIKQNNYAFFVPNQVAWKYWNDFISNGTATQDVIGSNTFNQDLEGVFKEPAVRLGMIMPYLKFAKGWSSPVTRFSALNSTFDLQSWACRTFRNVLCPDESGKFFTDVTGCITYLPDSLPVDFFNSDGGVNLHYCNSVWQLWNKLSGGVLNWLDKEIAFIPVFQKVNIGSTGSPNATYYYEPAGLSSHPFYVTQLRLTDIIFYGSDVQVLEICERLFGDGFSPSNTSMSESYSEDYTEFYSGEHRNCISFQNFRNSLPVDDPVSPFIVEKNYFSYKNFNGFESVNLVPRLNLEVNEINQNDSFISVDTVSAGGFYQYHLSSDIPYTLNRADVTTRGYNVEINGAKFFLPSQFAENSDDSWSDYEDAFTRDLISAFDFSSSNMFLATSSWKSYLDDFGSNLEFLTPYTSNSSQYRTLTTGYTPNASSCFRYYNNLSWLNVRCNINWTSIIVSYVSKVSGFETVAMCWDSYRHKMTFTSWWFYLCSNACRLLDFLNVQVNEMFPATYSDWYGFNISLMPMMCYALSWSEYFRNKMVSSPDPLYNSLNGVIYPSLFKTSEDTISTQRSLDVNVPNIDFNRLPSSGEASEKYFVLNSFYDIVAALFGLDYSYCFDKQLGTSQFEKRVILPNYYNSLFSLRFQNWAKDYFSSALFDPASGANDVEVPDTILELRSAQRMASFWQRTAFTRSVAQFFGQNFDVTPTHDQLCKPYLLGASHIDVNVGEVIQTSQTTDSSVQGTRSGLAAAHSSRGLVSNFFNEQGYLIVLTSHTLEQQYMQRLDKLSLAYDSFLDYPFPDFVGLGNQSIYNHEIYFQRSLSSSDAYNDRVVSSPDYSRLFKSSLYKKYGPSSSVSYLPNKVDDIFSADLRMSENHNIFGFTPRFTEYKFSFDEVHGQFRDEFLFWHSFRRFHSAPTLCHEFVSWEFVVADDELKRLFADPTSSDYFFVDMFVNISVKRKLPLQSRPEGV